jgi:hypothetical protein
METSQLAANAFVSILSNARREVAKEVENHFDLANVRNERLRKFTKQSRWDDLHVFMISGLELCKSGYDLAVFYRGWRIRYGPCTQGAEIRSVFAVLKKAVPQEVRELVESQLFTRNGQQGPSQMTLVSKI